MQLGIDCNLHKNCSLDAICKQHGIETLTLLELILARDIPLCVGKERDWSEAPLDELVDHLIAHHHEYLRRLLPLIQMLADKAVLEQGYQHPELHQIREHFLKLKDDLKKHFNDEEKVMFPTIRQLAAMARGAKVGYRTIDSNVGEVKHELDIEVSRADLFRQLTNHYNPPGDACTAYQALIENLSELERELNRHYHLEINVLIPRALDCESQLRN